MGSNIAVSAPDGIRVERAAARARLPRRRRFLPVRNGEPRRRRAAVGAVGRGGRHDDEPRGPRHSPAPRRRRRPRACGPTSTSCAASPRALGKRRFFRVTDGAARSSTSCAGRAPADRRLLGHHLRAASTPRTACSGRVRATIIRARRGCSPNRFPTPSGRARFHARPPSDAGRRSGRRIIRCYLTTGRVLAHYQSGTQTRRVAELQEAAPEPLAEMHPATARRPASPTATASTLTTRRGAGDVHARS